MMKSRILLISFGMVLFQTLPSFGQQETKSSLEVIMNDNNLTFAEKTTAIELMLEKLDVQHGIENDGIEEKYQRWKHFWEMRLDESGKMVDYTQLLFEEGKSFTKSGEFCNGLDVDVTWTNLNYNENMGYQIDLGRTSTIAFSPSDASTFYVGAAWGGIWKTENGGTSYTNLNDRLPLAAVSGIFIDPANEDHLLIALSDMVWYGSNAIGIYETFDGGISFQATGLTYNLSQNKQIYSLISNPGNADVLFAATSSGLLRSDDHFSTNTLVISGDVEAVQFCQADPTVGYATSRSGRFYKTIDGGTTFTLITDFGSGTARLDVDLVNPDKVVATCGSAVFFSTDGGTTFTESVLPESNCVVSLIPGTTSGLTVGNFDIYRSDDGGVTFYQVSHWLGSNGLATVHVDQRNSFTNPFFPSAVYFCNDGGVFRYNPSNNDFTNLSKDLIITQYYDIAISETDSLVVGGGSQDNGNVTRNSNGAWQAYAGTGDGMEQGIHLTNSAIRFWEYQYGGMRRFDALTGNNVSIEPQQQTTNGAWHTPYQLDPSNENRMVCGYQRVYESFDLGDTWTYLGGNFSNGNSITQLAIAPSNSDVVYASTASQMWRKVNGIDWTSCTMPSGVSAITGIVVDNDTSEIVYMCSAGFVSGKKVYRSEDSGTTWTNITYNLPNLPVTAMRLLHAEMGASESGVFVGNIGNVYFLKNGESTWLKYGCIPATEVSDIEIQYSTNKVFIGTHGRGVFSAKMDNFEVLGLSESTTDETTTIYPNPTDGSVSISSDQRIVSFIIYDELLRKVFVINDLDQGDDGQINLKELANGTYLVELKTDTGEVIFKRIIKN